MGSSARVRVAPDGSVNLDEVITSSGSAFNWARVRFWNSSDQSVTWGSETAMDFNQYVDDGAGVMEAHFGTTAIKVLAGGLFSITVRAYWHTYQGASQTIINGIDKDAWAGWSGSFAAFTGSNQGGSTMTVMARLPTSAIIWPAVYQNSGSAQNLSEGSFMEMIRLGSIDLAHRGGGFPGPD